jgi:hypothetical protein
MNGPQDVGGRHGFGRVIPEDEAIRFHAEWEKRVLGITLAAGALGYWNIDASRHTRESLPPAVYYNASYYEIWLRALEILLKRAGEVSAEELAAGRALADGHSGGKAAEGGKRIRRDGERRSNRQDGPRALGSNPGTASEPRTTSRKVIRDCRAMRATARASSSRATAATSIQTPTPISKGSSLPPLHRTF